MNKFRCSYVKRKKYLSLLKQIKSICAENEVELKISHRPIIWDRYGGAGPNFGEQRGVYSVSNKSITAVFYGKIGYARKLELLLHELRHAIHHNEGLYKDYYNEKWEDLEALLKEENPALPCRKIGLLAEMDCNRFAYYWLKKQGINIPKSFKYKGETMADYLHNEFKRRKSLA